METLLWIGITHTDMPELPEVETVRRELSSLLAGKTLDRPIVYFSKMIKTPVEEYVSGVTHALVLSIGRKGKFLILHLDNRHKVLFHLRMEGKLYVVDKEQHSFDHLSLFFPFLGEEEGLAFYDTRKFGVTYYLKEEEEGPLAELGKEPFEIQDPIYLYQAYNKTSRPLKEALLDQSIMTGLGNIYANEVLFASHLSPFLDTKKLTKEDCASLLSESIRILDKAISLHGSTVRSYHASIGESGSFQDLLQVYGREGKPCFKNPEHRIQKVMLGGRGTYFCAHCQKTGISIGLTGKIASGKSLAASYFKELGFVSFSADEEVHLMYHDKDFLQKLKSSFPEVFLKRLSKKRISFYLKNSPSFRRKYEAFVFAEVRRRAENFMQEHDGKNKVMEIPLLFDAHMESMFTVLVGTETHKQKEHLLERGEDPSRASFNEINSYDRHRYELDYILHTDGSKEELKNQVRHLVNQLLDT